jgi:gamma-glutamylaminecyclotransferase
MTPEDAAEMVRLFVYGTLRTGGGMEWRLEGFHLLRVDRLAGVLFDLGEYPTLVLGGDAGVEGEIWEGPIETLTALDAYEQVGTGLFERVEVPMEDGACWVYVAGPALTPHLLPGQIVPGGRWSSPPLRP